MANKFNIYRYTDSGAPQINGFTGSLVTVLSNVLVYGYGGTGSLGWTASYTNNVSGTIVNQAALQMNSKPYYLRIFDYPVHGSTQLEAVVKFDETLSSLNVPTFVTDSFVRKSATTESINRPWILFGDSRSFYLFVQTLDATIGSGSYMAFGFGEFDSYIPNEQYNIFEISRNATGNVPGNEGMDQTSFVGSVTSGNWIARPYTRVFMTSSITSIVNCGKHGDTNKGVSGYLYGNVNFTNQTDGGIYLSPIYLHETSGNIRGKLRGMWHFLHPIASVNDGDTFSGSPTGNLAGKTFMIVKKSANGAVYAMETSNTLS